MHDFKGDSSGLCHYWSVRFPLGLLAILLAISERQIFGSNRCGTGSAATRNRGIWLVSPKYQQFTSCPHLARWMPNHAIRFINVWTNFPGGRNQPIIRMQFSPETELDPDDITIWNEIWKNLYETRYGAFYEELSWPEPLDIHRPMRLGGIQVHASAVVKTDDCLLCMSDINCDNVHCYQ